MIFIANNIFFALYLNIFIIKYLQNRVLYLANIISIAANLNYKPVQKVMEDNYSHIIVINFKKKIAKKKKKYI